jgi:hypothetical protein
VYLTDELAYSFYYNANDFMVNKLAIPCPNCSFGNRIDFNLFHLILDSLESFEKKSLPELQALQLSLTEKLKHPFNASVFETAKKEILEIAPELDAVKSLPFFTVDRTMNIVGLIIAALGLVIAYMSLPPSEQVATEKPTIEKTIITNNYYQAPALGAPKSDNKKLNNRVSRNEPCPCGSGKKFKKCHGKE